jgi:hypothetical protein
MSGFTKLSSSLIASSVWNEPDKVRIVWITMLAMADQNGDVKASIVGLAHQARESLSDTENALAVLASPDPHSGRKEQEGRRVTEIEGGWHLVTHKFYRELGMSEEMKAYWREKQREHRLSKTVNDSQGESRMSCSVLGNGNASVSEEKGIVKGKGRPTLKEVVDFIGSESMANDFWDYYESNGWKVGRNPMKDWQSAARRWKRSNTKGGSSATSQRHNSRSNRNDDTLNAGKSGQYRGLGKVVS